MCSADPPASAGLCAGLRGPGQAKKEPSVCLRRAGADTGVLGAPRGCGMGQPGAELRFGTAGGLQACRSGQAAAPGMKGLLC